MSSNLYYINIPAYVAIRVKYIHIFSQLTEKTERYYLGMFIHGPELNCRPWVFLTYFLDFLVEFFFHWSCSVMSPISGPGLGTFKAISKVRIVISTHIPHFSRTYAGTLYIAYCRQMHYIQRYYVSPDGNKWRNFILLNFCLNQDLRRQTEKPGFS